MPSTSILLLPVYPQGGGEFRAWCSFLRCRRRGEFDVAMLFFAGKTGGGYFSRSSTRTTRETAKKIYFTLVVCRRAWSL